MNPAAGILALTLLASGSLPIGPEGYRVAEIPLDQLARLAEHEFESGMNLKHDAVKARARFREAGRIYDELWRRGVRDPDLALNRSHSHRLAGDLPAAIAALNQGLAVARWSRPLQAALDNARAAVEYPVSSDLAIQCRPARTATIGNRMSPPEAMVLATGLWLVLCLAVTRFAMTRAAGWLVFAGLVLTALLGLGALWWHDSRVRAAEEEHPFAVVTRDAAFRKGNADSFPYRLDGASILPAGVEVRELGRRGGWVQVRLASGAIGWLPERAVLKINE